MRTCRHPWSSTLNGVVHVVVALLAGTLAGCGLIPDNVDSASVPGSRELLAKVGNASFSIEDGVDGLVWLEVTDPDTGRTVGGYFSALPQHRRALVVLLDGASLADQTGGLFGAYEFSTNFGKVFQDTGFLTWALDIEECGTPYGDGDLADTLTAIDWLEREGKTLLNVDRIYLSGYSSGGTVASVVGWHRSLTAAAPMGALTQSDQFDWTWPFYELTTWVFADNIAFCQLGTTLDAYGAPGSPAWDAIDSVGHVADYLTPMLFVHGTADVVYSVSNTQAMQQAYEQAVAQGLTVPPMYFAILDGETHTDMHFDPAVRQLVLDFFSGFEPTDSEPWPTLDLSGF